MPVILPMLGCWIGPSVGCVVVALRETGLGSISVGQSPAQAGLRRGCRLENERNSTHLNSDFFIVAKPIPVAPNELPT